MVKAIDWKCPYCNATIGEIDDPDSDHTCLTSINPIEEVYFIRDGQILCDIVAQDNPSWICESCQGSLYGSMLPEDLHQAKDVNNIDV